MNVTPTINGYVLEEFKAHLLEYTVAPCSFEDTYISALSRIVPVMLKPRVSLRTVTVKLDFEGSSDQEIALNISRLTSMLFGEVHLLLPDGFNYWCAYEKQSTPKEVAPWIRQVTFTFVGFRHGNMQTFTFQQSSTLFVEGNMETPAIITLYPAEGTDKISFNDISITGLNEIVTIDGVRTTVVGEDGLNKFRYTDMTEWPKLKPGENEFVVDGVSSYEISYFPIFC